MSNDTFVALLALSAVYPIVLTIAILLGAKHGKRARLEEQMAEDWVAQFGGTIEDARWIVANARPHK